MNLYLPTTILSSIYNYFTWYNLRQTSYVPQNTWKRLHDYLIQDAIFKKKLERFWGPQESNIPYNIRIIYFILYEIKTSIDIPVILWRDPVFITQILRYRSKVLQYAPDEIKSNRNYCLLAVKQNGRSLEYIQFRRDREIVLTAVQQYWQALYFASDDLQNDEEIVLSAINQNGLALKYAGPLLKSNKSIVLRAVRQNAFAIYFMDESLKQDYDISVEAVKENPRSINFIHANIKANPNFIVEFLTSAQQRHYDITNERSTINMWHHEHWQSFVLASDAVKKDRNIVMDMIKRDGHYIRRCYSTL